MVLNLEINEKSKFITLDWDDISYDEFCQRIRFIKTNPDVSRVRAQMSPCSGYHVWIEFYEPVYIAELRAYYNDDGNRLVNDLLNRSGCVHDVLWTRKTMDGITWEAVSIDV